MEEEVKKTIDSILTSVKKMLGLSEENEEFDLDIMMAINGAIVILTQLGVGPKDGFIVTSKEDTYNDWLGEMTSGLQLVKIYLFYKTRLSFDPPTQSSVLETYKEMIREIECRLNYQVDPPWTFD